MKILFLGDSITGWSDLSQWFKYSHVVESMIEARYGAGRAVVLNHGIGGNTTGAVLQRLPADALADKPDIVVLLIGGNDAGSNVPRDTTAANLDKILTSLQSGGARVLLLQYHVLPRPDAPEKTWSHLNSNNDLIAAAAQRHGCPVVDMAAAMQAAIDSTLPDAETDFHRLAGWRGVQRYRIRDLVGVDGVHLNGAGELVYGRTIFAKLLELGWLQTK